MNRTRTLALAECALLLAAAVALSYVKIIQLPFSGSVTLLSMLPLCLVSLRHGIGWGLGTAFAYSWFQILQGGVFAWGLTPGILIASLFLDYILAFTVLGLAGLFRRRGILGVVAGVTLVCALRFLSHLLAGAVLWANLEEFVAFGREWVGRPWLYSLCYNGVYMLPETVFTSLGAFILFRVPETRRILMTQGK
ncbi:MAG: energy-coupled thiamine transporter ThiT [Clostridia bacterium]|nr:energy-coupled thiamine transporter ThiT [Clostridia bacterium]